MDDQLTAASLRREAGRLRALADLHALRGEENNREACIRGAESHDRLANVIEYTEEIDQETPIMRGPDAYEISDEVLRIARGDTTNHENRSE